VLTNYCHGWQVILHTIYFAMLICFRITGVWFWNNTRNTDLSRKLRSEISHKHNWIHFLAGEKNLEESKPLAFRCYLPLQKRTEFARLIILGVRHPFFVLGVTRVSYLPMWSNLSSILLVTHLIGFSFVLVRNCFDARIRRVILVCKVTTVLANSDRWVLRSGRRTAKTAV